jgi:hypothetical protein
MGALTNETSTLKLYTSPNDEVWYTSGNSIPKPSNYSYSEFCDKLRFVGKKSIVRLAGSSKNSKLITKLYLAAQAGDIKEVQICSPQVERIDLDDYSPEKVLLNMRKWLYPPSLGGYRPVSTCDFLTYSLAEGIANFYELDQNSEELRILYKAHPMYKVLSFIPFLNEDACMVAVALTLDPRWFIDINSPNKLSNYFEYMGVNKLKAYSNASDVDIYMCPLKKSERRNVVVNSWQTTKLFKNNKLAANAYKTNFLVETYISVSDFIAANKKRADKKVNQFDEMDMATCQKFLTYLHMSWMNWLYPMPNPWQEPLFIPKDFFSAEEFELYSSFFAPKG